MDVHGRRERAILESSSGHRQARRLNSDELRPERGKEGDQRWIKLEQRQTETDGERDGLDRVRIALHFSTLYFGRGRRRRVHVSRYMPSQSTFLPKYFAYSMTYAP